MERTLFFGVLLFMVLSILNLKISHVAKKSVTYKLGIFFFIITLLFLAVGGISDEFKAVPVITALLTVVCFCGGIIGSIFKIFKSKLDAFLVLCLLIVLLCEVYIKLDPNGYVLYRIFEQVIDIAQIEIMSIIGFIVLLSIKVFSGIFFKKELNFINKNHFQVKDGKGK